MSVTSHFAVNADRDVHCDPSQAEAGDLSEDLSLPPYPPPPPSLSLSLSLSSSSYRVLQPMVRPFTAMQSRDFFASHIIPPPLPPSKVIIQGNLHVSHQNNRIPPQPLHWYPAVVALYLRLGRGRRQQGGGGGGGGRGGGGGCGAAPLFYVAVIQPRQIVRDIYCFSGYPIIHFFLSFFPYLSVCLFGQFLVSW